MLLQSLPSFLRRHLGRNTNLTGYTVPIDGLDLGLGDQCKEKFVVFGFGRHLDRFLFFFGVGVLCGIVRRGFASESKSVRRE